jgi:hypothetical protein
MTLAWNELVFQSPYLSCGKGKAIATAGNNERS